MKARLVSLQKLQEDGRSKREIVQAVWHLLRGQLTPRAKRGPVRACLVAILRDEEPFLHEWLAYHRLLGFDHFLLYDMRWWNDPGKHSNVLGMSLQVGLERLPGIVVPGRNRQTRAYLDAVGRARGRFEWMAFLDGDEFLALPHHDGLKSFLADYHGFGAVSLQWYLFGHNGHLQDPHGFVLSSLTRRRRLPARMYKTLSWTAAVRDVPSAHHCDLHPGYLRVDANKLPFLHRSYPGQARRAHVNHYHCRSYDRWMSRVQLGPICEDLRPDSPEHRWRFDEQECHRAFVERVSGRDNEVQDTSMTVFEATIRDYLERLGVRSRSV